MLTEEEIKEAEKIGQKSEVVRKLLDFWGKAQIDGQSALRIALNEKLLEISANISRASIDDKDDKTFERIDKIVAALGKLPKEENKTEESAVSDKHKNKAIL